MFFHPTILVSSMAGQQLDGGLVPQSYTFLLLLLSHFFVTPLFTILRQTSWCTCGPVLQFFTFFSVTLSYDIFLLFLFAVSLQTRWWARRLAGGTVSYSKFSLFLTFFSGMFLLFSPLFTILLQRRPAARPTGD